MSVRIPSGIRIAPSVSGRDRERRRRRGVQSALVRVRTGCPVIEAAHRRRVRTYAHANHVPGVVCVARAFWTLPTAHRRGILLHELGHLDLGRRRHTEAEADREVRRRYGVQIRYRDSRWGRRLQYA